jgi:HK97 family phage major capsid protein
VSIEAINRELLTLQERLDHVAAKAVKTESGDIDFSEVTVYGDVSNSAKAERFIADQKQFAELLNRRAVMGALAEVENWRELAEESKALISGAGSPRGDLATRLAVALKSAPAGSVQGVSFAPVELKALMTTSAGYPPETLRSGRVEVTPTRPTLVMDLPPMIRTVQNAFKYVRESTFTNAAAEVAEGGAYPEASLAYTEVTEPVQKIAVHIPVTEEQLEDDPAVEDLIRARLSEMIRQRLDSQLLNGNGTAPNLRGVRNVSGINAVSQGSDTVLDAIYRGIVACRTVGYAQPDAIVIHPTNLQAVRLAKSTDGQYLFGPPSSSLNMPIWGLRVVETSAIPAGKVVVGDWANYSALAMRSNIDIQVGYSGTGFTAGIKTVRLDLRAAFAVFRPSAFAEVTLA